MLQLGIWAIKRQRGSGTEGKRDNAHKGPSTTRRGARRTTVLHRLS